MNCKCGNTEKFITNVTRVFEVVIDNDYNFIEDGKKTMEGYACDVVRCSNCNELLRAKKSLNTIKYK